ncbi:hypothetical protein Fmac_033007 [Flemingia macrophylla]|uniref:Uncharacterized protein n=1 Tax=Flemingia macrophylla TaxID=520843 RepID=A0ABD1L6K5_9FABA
MRRLRRVATVQECLVHGKNSIERKKKRVASEVRDTNKGNGDENTFSALGKDAPCKERKSEDEHVSIAMNMDKVAKYESRSSCRDMFTMSTQKVCNGGREGIDQVNISNEKTTLGKRQIKFQHLRNNLDYPVEKTGGGHQASKLSVSERVTMHSGGNRSSSTEISACSKGCHKEGDAVVQGTTPNQSKDAEISKRKQQREAVEAILYSSLISLQRR